MQQCTVYNIVLNTTFQLTANVRITAGTVPIMKNCKAVSQGALCESDELVNQLL